MGKKYLYAIRRISDGKFYQSSMSGHGWSESPYLRQCKTDKIEATRSACNIQLNCPEYRDDIEVMELEVRWDIKKEEPKLEVREVENNMDGMEV